MIIMAQFFSTVFMDVYSLQQDVSIAKGCTKVNILWLEYEGESVQSL
jgi:hypothetical protein